MVGDRKNKADKWLPPRVYRGRKSYEWHPKGGGSIKLLERPADGIECEQVKSAVWAAYAEQVEKPPKADDMAALVDAFHASPQFIQLSALTQRDYLQYSKRITRVFGEIEPSDMTAPMIRNFMDALAGQGKTVAANRHHSYLSVLFSWGIERAWCVENPAKQVRKFRELSRDRYIEDWEFDLVKNVARKSAYPYIAPFMELAYLCRGRSGEIRALTEKDVTEEGIYLKRAKGSSSEITGYSDRLHAALAEARSLFPSSAVLISRPLIHSKTGEPIPAESLKTAFNRVMHKAMESGLKEWFTLHDVKAKGISDHSTKASGHKTKKMQAVYDRKPSVTPATK
jgi:integrase